MIETVALTSQRQQVLTAGRLKLSILPESQQWSLHGLDRDTMLMNSPSMSLMVPKLANMESDTTAFDMIHADRQSIVLQSVDATWGQCVVTITAVPQFDAFDIAMKITASEDIRLASIECFKPGTMLNFYKLINYRNRHHTEQVWPELLLGGAGCQTDTTSRDWQFAPHPTLMFLQRNDQYLSWGALQLPRDTFGMHVTIQNHKVSSWEIDYGGMVHGLAIRAGETYTTQVYRMRLSEQVDPYAAYADFGQQIRDSGLCPQISTHQSTPKSWWLEPLYCTWIDQCMMASYKPADELQAQANNCNHPTRSALNSSMVRQAVQVICEHDLPFRTILLDEGWHQSRGIWEPHPERFPDMRQLVDELHDQGFKVVIWWAWPEIEQAAESQIDPALLMGQGKRNCHQCLMYDFSNPHVQDEYLKPLFTKLFSDAPGCFNLDGIKTDFQADKIHADMPLCNPSWRGEENYLYHMHQLFYTTLKTIKPDAVHIGCAGHYWLTPFIDINRTYDVHGSNVQEHHSRARMLQSTTFNTPVAYDFHNYLDHLEAYFDSANELGCSVEVGNVLFTKEHLHAKSKPADESYWKQLAAKLAPMVSALLLMVMLLLGNTVNAQERGADILPVFSRAHAGLPLRAAVLGGSITQAGKGWITDWLIEQFPLSTVTMRNAGMSATGSQLGIFRVERDVISAQPDIVIIEYAVNDGGSSDDDAIRFTESIVVRLKSLPNPPAIVFLEAAAKGGSKRFRHQQVAAHYNLLDIDLQLAVDDYLQSTGKDWAAIMSDNVHPNEQGHALYAKVIAEKLKPFVERSRNVTSQTSLPLPLPLSSKPLILDGQMMPIDPADGWNTLSALPHWWNKFFNGVITCDKPGTELTLTARGSMIGLLYPLDNKTAGTFYASLDGQTPILMDQAFRSGYSYRIFGNDLAACDHTLKIAVANPIDRDAGTVMLGYLLVAGHTHSTRELVPHQPVNLSEIAARMFTPIAAKSWRWTGSYGGNKETSASYTTDFDTVFEPEISTEPVQWKACEQAGEIVNFAQLTGNKDRGVCYARTHLQSDTDQESMIALKLDYFAKLWLNGKLIHTIDRSRYGGMGPTMPILLPVSLKAGDNQLVIKVHAGSGGNMFGMYVQKAKQ